jgi:hypothetical protein
LFLPGTQLPGRTLCGTLGRVERGSLPRGLLQNILEGLAGGGVFLLREQRLGRFVGPLKRLLRAEVQAQSQHAEKPGTLAGQPNESYQITFSPN